MILILNLMVFLEYKIKKVSDFKNPPLLKEKYD